MEKTENRVRINISITPEVKKYLDEQASAFGMNVSAYITMVVQQYRQQSEAMEALPIMVAALKEKMK